nr:MAG TPA: hypothetical protein [Caudoviricetes sp.]
MVEENKRAVLMTMWLMLIMFHRQLTCVLRLVAQV